MRNSLGAPPIPNLTLDRKASLFLPKGGEGEASNTIAASMVIPVSPV